MNVNKKAEDLLALDFIKRILFYCPINGKFFWIEKRGRNPKTGAVGTRAGMLHKTGYRILTINKRQFKEHRVAWFYMTGEWPKNQIDHINGIKNDNRFCNLRNADSYQNARNVSKTKKNKSGYKGVVKNRKKFEASISTNNGRIFLGCFKTKEDAFEAYKNAAILEHGEYANIG